MHLQYAALCFRVHRKKPQILLITSRGTGRWVVPKGWPMDGKSPGRTAEQEAWEEAGVKGEMQKTCMGTFTYDKWIDENSSLPCIVELYPLEVSNLSEDFPEKEERRRKWFSPKKAASLVCEPELAALIESFDPSKLT
ncbi:MAG: NUDIX hydrolase [Paracoccaceae bacterium]